MNDLVKWFGTSLGIHLGGAVLVVWLAAGAIQPHPPIIIDFTLNANPASRQTQKRPGQPAVLPKQRVVAPVPVAARQEPARQKSRPATVVSRNTSPSPPVSRASNAASEDTSRQVSLNMPPTTGTSPHAVQTGEETMTSEKARQRYLKEHFTYIRDLITKRLSYPPTARRMGWSGRLVLTFVVAEDGTVRSVHIKESSGYQVLDDCAMETVRSSAPFPKPPVAAEIVLPVQYRLQ